MDLGVFQTMDFVKFMFLLVFQSTQNEVVIQVIFYPGGKKLSVLTRCPLYSVRFMEVFLCEFVRKTAGTLGFCPS